MHLEKGLPQSACSNIGVRKFLVTYKADHVALKQLAKELHDLEKGKYLEENLKQIWKSL